MGEPENTTLPNPLRVLLVEDDPDQRDLIRDTLCLHFQSKCRHEVVAVGTGRECLDQDSATFDAVILDYRLPDMTGLDLLAEITRRCDAPVIFVTGENVADVAVKAIHAGAQDYVVKLGDYLFTLPLVLEKNIQQHQLRRQNALLQRELTARVEEIRVKNCQLEESLAMLRTAAATDHLTGLFNRRAFADLLERSYAEAVRYDFDLSCVMCDLDRYKNLNDTLGHQAGDRILVAAANVIRDNLRGSDTAARYGGDEFVLLLPHTSTEMAHAVCVRIRQQLAQATQENAPGGTGVTLSVGIASLRNDSVTTAEGLLACADRALYQAKEAGRDRIMILGRSRKPTPAVVA